MEGDPQHDLMFLSVDVPICRDFMLWNEQKLGRAMTYDESIEFLSAEFSFQRFRSKQLVDTICGEPHP